MLRFDECFKAVKASRPENTVLINPGVDRAQRFGIELVDAVSTFAMLADEVSPAQQAEMLGNRRTRDRESAGDLSGGLGTATEKIQNGAAGGIGEGLEGGLADLGSGICNRTVTHNA